MPTSGSKKSSTTYAFTSGMTRSIVAVETFLLGIV
jgi:hypothetical protein